MWSIDQWRNNKRNWEILQTEWYESKAYQNVWDTAKIEVRRKVRALHAYINKENGIKINALSF